MNNGGSSKTAPIAILPAEILLHIITFLPEGALSKLSRISRQYYEFCIGLLRTRLIDIYTELVDDHDPLYSSLLHPKRLPLELLELVEKHKLIDFDTLLRFALEHENDSMIMHAAALARWPLGECMDWLRKIKNRNGTAGREEMTMMRLAVAFPAELKSAFPQNADKTGSSKDWNSKFYYSSKENRVWRLLIEIGSPELLDELVCVWRLAVGIHTPMVLEAAGLETEQEHRLFTRLMYYYYYHFNDPNIGRFKSLVCWFQHRLSTKDFAVVKAAAEAQRIEDFERRT